MIVQELATGVMLYDYRGSVPREIFNELVRFFEHANLKGHHHSDVSEENLIYDPENKIMWIIDFGFGTDEISGEEMSDVDAVKLLASVTQWE